ncbi:hypothetical protein ABH941_000509 [Streptacidiphilus sp. EB103A]
MGTGLAIQTAALATLEPADAAELDRLLRLLLPACED